MKHLFFLLLLPISLQAQPPYQQHIADHRAAYKQAFVDDSHAPLDEAGVEKLAFFPPDSAYRVKAAFERTKEAEPFDMATYSGITKPYVQYGTLTFELHDTTLQMAVYQSLRLVRMPQYRDHLFIPFKDVTNGEATYGGGRYMDISKNDIKEGQLQIDFNKAYNPYCAYSDGYNCPIPPVANHLPVAIEAGERSYPE
ncbi:MAG TPA: DUF1684 domain-containing protein [Phaeodactylibacter sp.]|nr:DUF1684 domain-containing protein [Phaeodactylibacter sp.]